MDTKDTEGKAAETRSGPATGYATADDAIKALYDDSVVLAPRVESWLNIIVAEVRRLRAVLADINAIARLHPDESGREDFETLEVIADKSHNRGFSNADLMTRLIEVAAKRHGEAPAWMTKRRDAAAEQKGEVRHA